MISDLLFETFFLLLCTHVATTYVASIQQLHITTKREVTTPNAITHAPEMPAAVE